MDIINNTVTAVNVNLNYTQYIAQLTKMEEKTKSFTAQVKGLMDAVGVTKALSMGFDMLKDSVGSAMDRIDAMNQFQRVMTEMSGSADIANQALASIKDTMQGTAYGIDAATQACQNFVTSGMSLEQATEQVKTWADAVAFYGDGSNASYEKVTDAIAAMVAQGSVQQSQLQQLTDAGIPAVQLFADATGSSFDDVSEALASGQISSEEFVSVLQSSMMNGTASFSSIDGAAKQTETSWSQSFDGMKESVTNGMTSIITSIDDFLKSNSLPTIRDMIKDVSNTIEDAMNFIADHLPEAIAMIQTMMPFVVALGAAFATWKIVKEVQDAISSVQNFMTLLQNNSMIDSFLVKIGSSGSFLSDFAGQAVNAGGGIKGIGSALSAAMGGPVGIALAAFAALAAAFAYLWFTSEDFRQFWYDLWDGIANFLSECWTGIIEFFTVTIPQIWEDFKTTLAEFGLAIQTLFQDAWNNIIAFFTETIPTWIQEVIDWFGQLPYNIGYFIGQIIGFFLQLGLNLVSFLTEDLPAFIAGIIEWFQQLPGNIWTWLQEAWHNIYDWGSDIYDSASTWVSQTITDIVTWFQELPGKLWGWLCSAANSIVQWGSDLWNKGTAAAKELYDAVIDGITSLPGQVLEIGKNIVTGIWEGISGASNWILEKIDEFCSGIVDGIKDFFGIHSPSRVMRDMIGKFLPSGIAVGFEMAMPDASKDIKKSTQDMVNGIQREIDLGTTSLSTGLSLEKSVQYSNQASIINQFPKSFSLQGNALQPITLVLDNGVELAHAIVEPLNTELGLL